MTNKQTQEWKKDLIELHSVKAENKRLREALENIVKASDRLEETLAYMDMLKIAEQALKG